MCQTFIGLWFIRAGYGYLFRPQITRKLEGWSSIPLKAVLGRTADTPAFLRKNRVIVSRRRQAAFHPLNKFRGIPGGT
jgi:hypothetical protein